MTNFLKSFDLPTQSADAHNIGSADNFQTLSSGKKVNMHDYGYEQSGAHRGDPKALANSLNGIRSGRLIDENANQEQQQRNRDAVDLQILELEKQAENVAAEQRKITDVQIPKAQAEMRGHEDHILQVQKDEASGLFLPGALSRFKLWKLGIATLAVGLYLIGFYISAVYSGMIRNIGAEMENGNMDVKSLFANVFVPGAFFEFNFHWLAPILLLGFAIVLDILYDGQKGAKRIVSITVGVLLTLLLDGLIAYKIEEKTQELKRMMNFADPEHVWWMSADFYIVLLMGFIATIAWGIIFYAFKVELGKKDTRRVVALEIAHFTNLKKGVERFIYELKETLTGLEGKMAQLLLDIANLKERRKTMIFSKAELEKSINDFYDGWLEYLNGMGNSELIKMECEAVLEKFYADHINDRPHILPMAS